MLRITVHDATQAVTFQLEGRLAGAWVRELKDCWQAVLARRRKPVFRVDLTGATFVDPAGKACLTDMHRRGGEFVAADCLMSAIVAEITQPSPPDRGPEPEARRMSEDRARPRRTE